MSRLKQQICKKNLPAKIIWVTLDGAMHMASLQADFSW